jgi:hypothetical protein
MAMTRFHLPALAALAVLAVSAALSQTAVEGQDYVITVVDREGGREFDETLSFRGGEIEGAACREAGFAAAAYERTTTLGGGSFTAEMRNPGGETRRWTGTIRGDRIEGTMESQRPGGPKVVWSFAGFRNAP